MKSAKPQIDFQGDKVIMFGKKVKSTLHLLDIFLLS